MTINFGYRFLAQMPLEAAMAETCKDPSIDWRSPQRAGMAYFRVILESFHYLMRRKGLSLAKAKQVRYAHLFVHIYGLLGYICDEGTHDLDGAQRFALR